MIGYLSGKFLAIEDGNIIIDVAGVGYSVLVSARVYANRPGGMAVGTPIELFIHTNLRENALELFGFATSWEKKVFHALTSVSGVGPRTALAILGGLEPETILSAIVREDRATLNTVSGVGKKTTERLIIDLGEKARKLLAERPTRERSATTSSSEAPAAESESAAGKKSKNAKIPPQGASASANSSLDIADLWNEAIAALVNLGYREGDAIAAVRLASAKAEKAAETLSIEKLIMSSLQMMSRGMG